MIIVDIDDNIVGNVIYCWSSSRVCEVTSDRLPPSQEWFSWSQWKMLEINSPVRLCCPVTLLLLAYVTGSAVVGLSALLIIDENVDDGINRWSMELTEQGELILKFILSCFHFDCLFSSWIKDFFMIRWAGKSNLNWEKWKDKMKWYGKKLFSYIENSINNGGCK